MTIAAGAMSIRSTSRIKGETSGREKEAVPANIPDYLQLYRWRFDDGAALEDRRYEVGYNLARIFSPFLWNERTKNINLNPGPAAILGVLVIAGCVILREIGPKSGNNSVNTPSPDFDPDGNGLCVSDTITWLNTAHNDMQLAGPDVILQSTVMHNGAGIAPDLSLACEINNPSGPDYDLVREGRFIALESEDILMGVARYLPEGKRTYLAVFPNELVVNHGNNRGGYLYDLDHAEISSNGNGEIEMRLPGVDIANKATGATKESGSLTIIKHEETGNWRLWLEGTRSIILPPDSLTADDGTAEIAGLNAQINSLKVVTEGLAGGTQEGVSMDNTINDSGVEMNGEAQAISLSDAAVKWLNDNGYGLVEVDLGKGPDGEDWSNTTSWSNGKIVRISANKFLFIPHGELVMMPPEMRQPVINVSGMVEYLMEDGSWQYGIAEAPVPPDGYVWVKIYNRVGNGIAGKAWMALVADGPGKAAGTELRGKFQAIWDRPDVKIRARDGKMELVAGDEVVDSFDVEPTPSLPAELSADHASEISANHFPFKYDNNQLWVDWGDGQGLRLAGTYDAATQTWDWEYFQYGGPELTDEQLTALATKDELCDFEIFPGQPVDKCIFPNPKGGLVSLFKESMVATGRTAYGDYSDSLGNTGWHFLTEFMSYDPNGKPFTHWVETAIGLDSQPGVNILEFIYGGISRSAAFGQDQVPVEVNDLRGIWVKGQRVTFSYLLDSKEDSKKQGLRRDEAYFALLDEFIKAGGFKLNSQQILKPVGAIWPKP